MRATTALSALLFPRVDARATADSHRVIRGITGATRPVILRAEEERRKEKGKNPRERTEAVDSIPPSQEIPFDAHSGFGIAGRRQSCQNNSRSTESPHILCRSAAPRAFTCANAIILATLPRAVASIEHDAIVEPPGCCSLFRCLRAFLSPFRLALFFLPPFSAAPCLFVAVIGADIRPPRRKRIRDRRKRHLPRPRGGRSLLEADSRRLSGAISEL